MEPYAEYGAARGGRVYDPTPAKAVRQMIQARRQRVRFETLVGKLSQETGETESVVRSSLRNWRAAGLLPPPTIIKADGQQGRGTRGDWSETHRIGYHVIRALRPKNKHQGHKGSKGITIARRAPEVMADGDVVAPKTQQVATKFAALISAIDELKETPKVPGQARSRPDLVPLMEALRQTLGAEAAQFFVVSYPRPERIRLNTGALQRLLPLARGVNKMRLAELADEAPGTVHDTLEREALKTIWTKVVKAETNRDIKNSAIRWKAHEIEAVDENDTVIWRLSASVWAAR